MALYLEHFGLNEPPFRITPHTDFFFPGADRGSTLEALTYAVLHEEGIVKISGEVGSGKTMLCRMLMERLPGHVSTIYLATPTLARDEILHAIADDLEIRLSDRHTLAVRELQEHLIKLYGAGRRVVILVDEAHVMPDDTLEQVRLLSNLESSRHKLLQIVLFGQPELDATLAKPSLRQLRDRITHNFRMRPLTAPEVAKYLSFRMRAAGYRGPELFVGRACTLLAQASAGLTRRINILADKSLLAAYADASHAVTDRHVKAAIADAEFSPVVAPRSWRPAAWLGGAAAAGLLLGAALHWAFSTAPREPAASPMTPLASASPAKAPAPVAHPASPTPPTPDLEEELDLAEDLEELAATDEPPIQNALSGEQRRRLLAYSANGYKLLTERMNATRELLERAGDERYSIELFVTDNPEPARMERFLIRARDMVPLSSVYLVPMSGGAKRRLRVVYGDFDSAQQALEEAGRLPPKYQRAFRTSARSFAELRKQM